ncbi:MAG: hypothetical protein WC490_04865 [Candidatus Margulisiibacteriota bacterium]
MAANIYGVSHHQGVQSSASAQQNTVRPQNAQNSSHYGYDQVTLSTSVAPAASSSKAVRTDGTASYAERSENRTRRTAAAKGQTVKAVSDEEKHRDNKEAYDLLKMAAGLKGMLADLGAALTGKEA